MNEDGAELEVTLQAHLPQEFLMYVPVDASPIAAAALAQWRACRRQLSRHRAEARATTTAEDEKNRPPPGEAAGAPPQSLPPVARFRNPQDRRANFGDCDSGGSPTVQLRAISTPIFVMSRQRTFAATTRPGARKADVEMRRHRRGVAELQPGADFGLVAHHAFQRAVALVEAQHRALQHPPPVRSTALGERPALDGDRIFRSAPSAPSSAPCPSASFSWHHIPSKAHARDNCAGTGQSRRFVPDGVL